MKVCIGKNQRFLKCSNSEPLDKNKKTLTHVFRCTRQYKTNVQSLRKSFEVMNEMFTFNTFRV